MKQTANWEQYSWRIRILHTGSWWTKSFSKSNLDLMSSTAPEAAMNFSQLKRPFSRELLSPRKNHQLTPSLLPLPFFHPLLRPWVEGISLHLLSLPWGILQIINAFIGFLFSCTFLCKDAFARSSEVTDFSWWFLGIHHGSAAPKSYYTFCQRNVQ